MVVSEREVGDGEWEGEKGVGERGREEGGMEI